MKKGTVDSIYSLAQSAVTDSTQSTLKFLSRSGIQAKITRTAHAGCCETCAALAGSWVYGKEPKEIYWRHKYCTCTVSYDPGNGRVQNVHSKVWTEKTSSAKIEASSQATSKPQDAVEKATGNAKGSPLPIQDAISGANPNFLNGWEYQNNCQRCVQAYELRRRGYNVTAHKKIKSGDTVAWGAECFANGTEGEAEAAFSFYKTEAQIKKELKSAPDGARYAIYIRWKGRNSSAHVFIAEKENGIVRYLDPQTGADDVSTYFSSGRRGHFGFCRLDNRMITTNQQAITLTVE